MSEKKSRREFLKQGAALAAMGAVGPSLFAAEGPLVAVTRPIAGRKNVLVVVQLSGGNDGLNTVVPFGDPNYYDQRPQLGVPGEKVLRINNEIGLHPNAGALKGLYDEGRVAIIQGVGYPNPDRSHFRAMDIWHTAEPENIVESGWLAKAIQQIDARGDEPLTAINFGKGTPKVFHRDGVVVPSVSNLNNYGVFTNIRDSGARGRATELFTKMYSRQAANPAESHIYETGVKATEVAERLRGIGAGYQPKVSYPGQNPLAADLLQAARIHTASEHTRVIYTQIGGFDSHSNQLGSHPALMQQLGDAVAAFYHDLKARDFSSNVLIMAFSEFGRRVHENGSQGTDHGAAGPMFIIGDAVKGGLYGERHPSLTDLDRGDIRFAIDFRSVYATVLDKWMGLDVDKVLGRSFPHVEFI